MTSNAPFLAHLCGPSKPQLPLPPLQVGSDGLLRRTDVATPFIDELQENLSGFRQSLITLVTKADSDAPEPDVIRAAGWSRAMTTDVQRRLPDPDPDLIRHTADRRLAAIFTDGCVSKSDSDADRG
jgi:hypothetical protein